jgi:HupE/UreJ protein
MSALLQRARRGPGPLMFIVLVLHAASLLAHDPGLSALEVNVSGNEIAATLSVSPADAVALTLRDMARRAIRLEADDEPLVLEWQHVESDESGTRIRLVYAGHQSNTPLRRLIVTSDMPKQLARGHRELLTITADGRVAGESMLDAETTSLAVDLAAAAPSRVRQAWSFLTVGIHHILSGYDHLMFLAGLILAAVAVRDLLIALTAFTVAHSVSLALVAAGGVHAPPSLVEPLIAASIAWVGMESLLGRPAARWWIVFAFGLVHGFGFAGALTELGFGSSAGDVALALLSFNGGVELGQLAAASLLLPIVRVFRSRPSWHTRLQPACSMIIIAAGTAWLIQRLL